MEGDLPVSEKRRKRDQTIARVFYVMVGIFLLWAIISGMIYPKGDLFGLGSMVLSGLITIFIFIGILSFYFYREDGIIQTKKVITVIIYVSLFLTLITMMVGYFIFRPILLLLVNENIYGLRRILVTLGVFLLIFLSYILAFFLLLLQSFGLVSVIVLFQRKYFANILKDIRDITDALKRGDENSSPIYYRSLRWIFDIPAVLDTSKLSIQNRDFRKKFSWVRFKKAFILETIVACVIAIYISLNPILLQERSLNELFALASSISYFIPVVVLPLFIFLRLKVTIPGPAENYQIFDGLKSRLLSLVLALGTIILFLRLALESVSIENLLYPFIFYFLGFVISTLIMTFVYFNYFENALAEDILKDLKE
ncbi:MAG: hypothetical protein ACOC89_04290 [Candidatus Saliniplasma sp.]